MTAFGTKVAGLLLLMGMVVASGSSNGKAIFADETVNKHYFDVRRSLQTSSWPADHGDVARSKFTANAGLPRNVRSEDLSSSLQDAIPYTQWIYTGGKNSEFIYTISGRGTFQLSKLDSITLDILQQIDLPPSVYLGGLLMHANGHVYCVHSNTLYRFWDGDLDNVTKSKIPSSLNQNLIQTNGMLATSDGNLLIKQWNMNAEDTILMKFSSGPKTMKKLLLVIHVGIVTILLAAGIYSRPRRTTIVRGAKVHSRQFSWDGILLELLLGFVLTGIVFLVMLTVILYRMVGPFNVFEFLTSNFIRNNGAGGGELKVIDPITFEVVANLQMCERAGYPRMALSPIINADGVEEDAIVFLGDINVYQIRYNTQSKDLYVIPEWTRHYRNRWDGSFPGTGPTIFDGVTYFTDNTFPAFLWGHTFSLFRAPLNPSVPVQRGDDADKARARINTLGSGPVDAPLLTGVPVTKNQPGFLFFSVAISPIERDVIVWDTPSSSLQARRLDDLSLHWESPVRNIDCIVVAADRGHVYVTDYDGGSDVANTYLAEITAGEAKFTKLSKYFIVLDSKTGAVLANTTVARDEPMWVSLIVAGANNDMFFGTSKGILRIKADVPLHNNNNNNNNNNNHDYGSASLTAAAPAAEEKEKEKGEGLTDEEL